MQDFSNLNQIIGSKAVSQLPNILSNAMTRLSNWESTVRALPGNYQSKYRDVFMYHYDEDNHLVDDTPEDQMQSLETMVKNAVAQAEGIRDYLSKTTCGIVTQIDSASMSPTFKVVIGNKLCTKQTLPQNLYLRIILQLTDTALPTFDNFQGNCILRMFNYTSFGNEVLVLVNINSFTKEVQSSSIARFKMAGKANIVVRWMDSSYSIGKLNFDSWMMVGAINNGFNLLSTGSDPSFTGWTHYPDKASFMDGDAETYNLYNPEMNNNTDTFYKVEGGVDSAMTDFSASGYQLSKSPWRELPGLNKIRFIPAIAAEPFSSEGLQPTNIISNATDSNDLQDLVNLEITRSPDTDLVDILSSEFIDPQDVIQSLS
jgi:hypothetical protein